MKKFFLFLCALCGALGGAAQTETLSGIGSDAITAPVSGNKYVIKTQGQGDTPPNAYLCASATGAASAETTYTTGADGMRFVWLFTQEGDKWKITNAKTNKQLTFESTDNDGRVTLTDAGTSITLDVSGTAVGLKNSSDQYIDASHSGTSLCTWSGGVSGSRTMHIYEADVTMEIIYNYKYNGTQIGSQTFNLAVGDSYPQAKPAGSVLSSYVDPSLLDFEFPTGTVSVPATFDVNVTLSSSFPIEPGSIYRGKFVTGTKWYTLKLKGKYAAYNSTGDYFDDTAATTDNSAPYLFAFTGNPVTEGLSIYNKAVGVGKVVYDNSPVDSNNDPIPTEASPTGTWSIGTHSNGKFWLRQGNTGTWYLNSRNSKLGFWNSSGSVNNDGSEVEFTFAEATPEDVILATKVYTIKPKDATRGALYAPTGVDFLDACGGTKDNAVHKDIAIDPSNTAQQFAFVTLNNGKTYLYSVGLRKFITESTSQKAAPVHKPADYVTVEESDTEEYFYIKFNGSEMLNISTGYKQDGVSTGNAVTGWNNVDDGNRLKIVAAGDFADADAVFEFAEATMALKAKLNALNDGLEYVGEGVNQYTASIANYVTSVNDLGTYYEDITNETTTNEINAKLAEATTLAGATFTINQPVLGKFYRFKNGSKYLSSILDSFANFGGTGNVDKMTMVEDGATGATIFYLDSNSKLVAYSNGLFTQNFTTDNYAFEAVGSTGNAVAFTDGQGTTAPRYHISCGSRYIYGAQSDGRLDAGGTAPEAGVAGYDWEIEEVTSLPVNVSSAVYYGTLYTPVALAVPEGVEAFTGTINGEYLHLNPVSSTIPAGTAVVLKYTDAVKTAGSLSFATAADVEAIRVNALSGQVNTIAASGITNLYTLQNPATGIGFYPYDGTNLNGFKAYMTTGTRPVRGFLFEEDGTTTGINALETETPGTQAIYDLSGRRVNKAQKGLYIVNGKKVILK